MKSLSFGIQALLFILILSSCEGPKKSPDNQSVGGATTQPAVESKETSQPVMEPKATETQEKIAAEGSEILSGTEIVERATSGLIRKLNLSDVQSQKIKVVLTESFLGMGQELNMKYPKEKGKNIRRNIISQSSEKILPMLDATQQELFKKILLQY